MNRAEDEDWVRCKDGWRRQLQLGTKNNCKELHEIMGNGGVVGNMHGSGVEEGLQEKGKQGGEGIPHQGGDPSEEKHSAKT